MKNALGTAILFAIFILLLTNFSKIAKFSMDTGDRLTDDLIAFIDKDVELGPLQAAYQEFENSVVSERLKDLPEEKQREIVDQAFQKAVWQIGELVTSKAETEQEREIAQAFRDSLNGFARTLTSDVLQNISGKQREKVINTAFQKLWVKAVLITAINSDILVKLLKRMTLKTAFYAVDNYYGENFINIPKR